MEKLLDTVCVFCGASQNVDYIYQESAIVLGKELAINNYNLVYGGGKLGLMGLVATSALENGGKAYGFIPEHLQSFEGGMEDLTELHIVDNMHTRKWKMSKMADGFVLLPGGFGSMDEFFEIITWRQIKLHDKPVVIVNTNGYWSPLIQLMEGIIEKGFAREKHRKYFSVVDRAEDAIGELEKMAKEIKNKK